jgi:hypothetical protein
MDESKNPFRNYPLPTTHLMMQILAWIWRTVFSLSIGSYFVFGVTAFAHALLIGAIFTTAIMFQWAERKAE